ncbi:hypothetical protein SAMN04488528_100985 [Clostridium frigidicarnis]|uniref:Uncharacterized protein n=1 Tax=Clostridium frigidicarnis TaxID=84698 RepID=A0A1I0XS31_9CLOT|nr:hypothetical protein SAMN04488528_100985 [Clostridium frigidicarnis]
MIIKIVTKYKKNLINYIRDVFIRVGVMTLLKTCKVIKKYVA